MPPLAFLGSYSSKIGRLMCNKHFGRSPSAADMLRFTYIGEERPSPDCGRLASVWV